MDLSNSTITLVLDGIKGESQIEKNALDILSWSWGMSNPTTKQGSGLSAGTPAISEVHFSKIYCSGSPIIMQYLLQGKHFQKATLNVCKSTGGSQSEPYFTIELDKVFVTSYSTGGDVHEVDLKEQFSLSFEVLNTSYKPQDTSSGAVSAAVTFKYDVMQKKSA